MATTPTRGANARTMGAALAAAALTVTLSGCGDLLPGQSDPVAQPAPTRSATVEPTPEPTPSGSPTQSARPPAPTAGPTPAADPTATSTPSSPAQPPTQTTSPTSTPTPSPTPTRTSLRYGDKGEKVLQLQQRLSDLGYWLGTPDGSFGGLTQQAVFAYQKAAGLSRDGVVGPMTEAALADGIRPKSRVGGNGVEIDLDRQLLLIVRDGSVVRVLNTSTGNGQPYVSRGTERIARTPTGSYAVYREVNATEEAELGTLYRPKYFVRGYAIHGSPSIPAWPASHGCARVSNAAMNMLWDSGYLSMGTPVTVYR